MIDLSTQNEWQHRCEETGLILPWYTKPCLDEISTWDLKGKKVFEYGMGASSLWWAAKCKKLYGVECDGEWFNAVAEKIGTIASFEQQLYLSKYPDSIRQWVTEFDIVVIDGMERDDCIRPALDCLKPGGALILDNWDQLEVWLPTYETRNIVESMKHTVYHQEGHPNWKTMIAYKP